MKLNFYKQKNSIFLIFFYFLAFYLASVNVFDFGVHIEEKFHRLNGHYWLNYVAECFGFENLQRITQYKIDAIGDYTLSSISRYNKYGVIFDLPAAYLEIVLGLDDISKIYYLKHILSFSIFLISSFYFYNILEKRYNNFYISFLGLVLFITTPRIFGDSFLYKDVLFLSIFTISLYYFLKILDRFSLNNLFFFSLFCAFAINLRIFAIFLPLFFLIIIFMKTLEDKNSKKIYTQILFFFISLILFTYLFWPYLWENPITSFFNLFKSLKTDLINVKILYFNDYVYNTLLPDTYLINWFVISNPIPQVLFFFFGYLFYARRFIKRFLHIKTDSIYPDLWRSKNEMKDFIIFFIFSSFFFIFLFFNAPYYNGWRLVYFYNFFIIYFGLNILSILLVILRKKKFLKSFVVSIIFFQIFYNVVIVYKSHPYQSIYFSDVLSEKFREGFEGDYYGLSAKHFFKYLAKLDTKEKIIVAVASHTPLQRGLEGFSEELKNKFKIVGQEYHLADYIFKNNISEIDPRLNKKYEIPKNFSMIYTYKVNKTKIYEIYKSNK
tara:strand:+ start:14012 stop:15664 length:1653 start_codon:yes stop_codon:yes gene_type:complete